METNAAAAGDQLPLDSAASPVCCSNQGSDARPGCDRLHRDAGRRFAAGLPVPTSVGSGGDIRPLPVTGSGAARWTRKYRRSGVRIMRAVVVYESMYGNTHRIADAIGAGLEAAFDVRVVPVSHAEPELIADVDLVVVGGPTHVHGMSRASTRKAAV